MESVRGVVQRAVNILSKQHQMGPKALDVNPQTSYGPEGRGGRIPQGVPKPRKFVEFPWLRLCFLHFLGPFSFEAPV